MTSRFDGCLDTCRWGNNYEEIAYISWLLQLKKLHSMAENGEDVSDKINKVMAEIIKYRKNNGR
ncbi:MAG: hypothetical protein LBD50_00975 [Rickettsiales bacterium]|nr:hypothetical protein [Rickettsiales bacterium]